MSIGLPAWAIESQPVPQLTPVLVYIRPGVQWPPPPLSESLASAATALNNFLATPLGQLVKDVFLEYLKTKEQRGKEK